ncbi:hypothetical protein A0J61_00665 [Choanephora cucurbitarum]|uniref:Uncharacterized protein n=1 Tax=Choanephora cucurbitarum TaxID=101091 RepID=A0A1C7NQ90_9FUNG|nr:hypothetical protein A0J61_00665 [Choanephora cucurbitarum]
MTKEPNTPKAVNIIRPTGNTNYGLLNPSHGSNGSTTSNTSQRRPGSVLSASSTGSRKPPRIAHTVIKEKPTLNLYHPPTRKPSYDDFHRSSPSSSRPSIEIYKPQPQQQQVKKSYMTHPSFSASDSSLQHIKVLNNNNRPRSSSSYKPPANYRSVLGVINTPAINEGNRVIHEVSVDNPVADRQVRSVLSYASSEEDDDDDEDDLEDNLEGLEDEDESDSNDEKEDQDSHLHEQDDTLHEDQEEEEEEEEVVEARVNRKIEDLELTVKSLLTVNAMLEATVRKQASQLNQYKKSGHIGNLEDIDAIVSHEELIGHSLNGTEQTEAEAEEEDWEKDELFQKLKRVTEQLIEQGQKSVEFEYKILGRVLSNYDGSLEQVQEEEEDEEKDEDNNDTSSLPLSNQVPIEATIPNNKLTMIPASSSRKKQPVHSKRRLSNKS